ncbi:hypothetical protein [Candidatus Phytoplasma ziziphi]|nr:hypothetical protein [Candidatus Phytoplasma ziziphi]
MLASWFFLKHLTSEDVYKDFLKENKFFNITRDNKKTENINIETIQKEQTEKNKEETEELKSLRKNFFKEFIVKNAEKSENNFFTTSIFENSDFFRNIISDLFIEVLTIDKDTNDKDVRIKELLTEAINRILTN